MTCIFIEVPELELYSSTISEKIGKYKICAYMDRDGEHLASYCCRDFARVLVVYSGEEICNAKSNL